MAIKQAATKAATKKIVTTLATATTGFAAKAITIAGNSRTVRRLLVTQIVVATFAIIFIPLFVIILVSQGSMGGAGNGTSPFAVPDITASAYTNAADRANQVPGCNMPVPTLAAIYKVESNHGGGSLSASGTAHPPIVKDSPRGPLEGPGGFTGEEWAVHGQDGNGDGVSDPQNIHDSALATAMRLCTTQPADYSLPSNLTATMTTLGYSPEYIQSVIHNTT